MKVKDKERTIEIRMEMRPRFSEVDSMGVVWHGNYVQYLEDAREFFGRAHGMGYMDVYRNKLMLPVVSMNIEYKRSISFEDDVVIVTRFHETAAAKVHFTYEIRSVVNDKLLATAHTTQVFIDMDGELQLTHPDFYTVWKKDLPWKEEN